MKWERQFLRFDVFMATWSSMEGFRIDGSVGFLCVSRSAEKSFCINRNKQWALLDRNKAPNRTGTRTRHHSRLCLFLWIWGQIQQYIVDTTQSAFSPSLNSEIFPFTLCILHSETPHLFYHSEHWILLIDKLTKFTSSYKIPQTSQAISGP